MKRKRRLLYLVCLVSLMGALLVTSCDNGNLTTTKDDIIILYDNDVHCAAEGYAQMSALKKEMQKKTSHVAVVSCGDFATGGALGSFSRGDYIVRIMNAVGYDYVIPGNHEFDYQVPRLFHFDSLLTAKMLCCNFRSTLTGENVFEGSALHRFNQKVVGFVSVTTPYTPSATSPYYFTDTLYHPVYSFCIDSIAVVVQREVDNVHQQGADYVVLLSHLGDCDQSPTSVEIIQQTIGIDVVLDGHSHSTISCRKITNRVGDSVILSSTGSRFANIGCLTISSDDKISTHLIPTGTIKAEDATVADTIKSVKQEYDAIGRRLIGVSGLTLKAQDDEGRRLPRVGECLLGDFCADALRITLGTDIGWVNGGGIRADLHQGDIRFDDIHAILPFNNQVLIAEVSGQDIIDALEIASETAPLANGRFAQVSGLRYEIDTTISPNITYKDDFVVSINGERRVSNVRVLDKTSGRFEPIDRNRTYTLAATDYVLNSMGSGSSFLSKRILSVSSYSDVQILERYITLHLSSKIDASSIGMTPRIIYK